MTQIVFGRRWTQIAQIRKKVLATRLPTSKRLGAEWQLHVDHDPKLHLCHLRHLPPLVICVITAASTGGRRGRASRRLPLAPGSRLRSAPADSALRSTLAESDRQFASPSRRCPRV